MRFPAGAPDGGVPPLARLCPPAATRANVDNVAAPPCPRFVQGSAPECAGTSQVASKVTLGD